MARLHNYYQAGTPNSSVLTFDTASLLVRLDEATSAWVKTSVGGLVWLARVLHERDGSLTVGPWQLLPGGWEHAETFFYDGGAERPYGTPPVAASLGDGVRFLLSFALVDTGYVMVVRMGADGSFSTGPAATFPSVGAVAAPGTTGPTFMSRTGSERAVIIRREFKTIGGSTQAWPAEAIIVAVSGMGVSASGPTVLPMPANSGVYGWGTDDGSGWWGWSAQLSGTWATSLAWYRESGGVIERGTPIGLDDGPGNYRIPIFAPVGQQRTLATVGFAGSFQAYRVDLYRRDGLDIVVERSWTGTLGANAGTAARDRRSLVDAVVISTNERRYRQASLLGSAYILAEEAVYVYGSAPVDQNARSAGPTQFEWLGGSRLLALYTVGGKPDNLSGGTQDRNHVLAHRLMTMVVPPVCLPRYTGALAGESIVRVAQATAVVRMAPTTALAPTTTRDPCLVGTAELSGASQRVHPVGRR